MEEPVAGGGLEALVREHAALRRVATLVAREPPSSEVFATVTRETGQLLGAARATLLRVADPEHALVVASWSDGTAPAIPEGHVGPIGDGGILGVMLREPRPVRIDDFDAVGPGIVSGMLRDLGVVAGV